MGRYRPRGKSLSWMLNNDTIDVPIPGSIAPIKSRIDQKPGPVLFTSYTTTDPVPLVQAGMQVALRLKDGVSMTRFLHDFQPWMLENL